MEIGPPWLPLETQWPVWNLTEIQATTLTVDNANPEPSTPTTKDKTGLSQLINIANHSNLIKLLRITGFTLRFVRNCQKLKIKFTGPITPAELTQANLLWIREIQRESFATEINNLKAHTTRPQTNRLPLVCQLLISPAYFVAGGGYTMPQQRNWLSFLTFFQQSICLLNCLFMPPMRNNYMEE